MGIADLKQELRNIPGAENLVMRYEDGGKVQVFEAGGSVVVRVGPMATTEEIKKAFQEAIS